MYQNEKLKASITHTTTLRGKKKKGQQPSKKIRNGALPRVKGCASLSLSGGIEEVFASVGESVSLSCHNTSSLGVSGSVQWAVGGDVLSRGSLTLVIRKVSTLHAAEYRCSDSTDQQRVFNRVRLQTLEGEWETSGPKSSTKPDSSHLPHLLSRVSVQLELSLGKMTSPWPVCSPAPESVRLTLVYPGGEVARAASGTHQWASMALWETGWFCPSPHQRMT